MTETITKYRWFLAAILFAVAVVLASNFIVDQRTQQTVSTIQVQLAEQQALLSTIAETTARNGADSITEAIVADCAIDDRSRFNDLLGSLDAGLPAYELIELEQLFAACGNFYSERKAVMVSRFSREIEIYEVYIDQLSAITGTDQAEEYKLAEWQKLAENEEAQDLLYETLVSSQKEIIDNLLAGNTSGSEQITTILEQVRETKEALILATTQAENIRSGLTAL